ncbi:MAG: hypothetical protein KKF79_05925 [Gammaproteobacteria bacterium]|nr:hypothetical protein [Gammaproteobacteria bacterium]
MRTLIPALLSISLGCGCSMFFSPVAFASDFNEESLTLDNILLKRSYTNSARVGDALYLWDNVERARYVDRYFLSPQGELQFKQRLSLPGMPLVYSSTADADVRPQFELTVVGNKAMSHSTNRLNLLDAEGHLLPDPLGDNAEYRALFGYSANSQNKAQFVGMANDSVLAWHADSKTLSRWRLNADNKLELLVKKTLDLAAFPQLVSNGSHHFLIEQSADGKTRAHRFNLFNLELGKSWEVPADVKTWWAAGLSLLTYVDSLDTPSANIRRLKLGATAIIETIPDADFSAALGRNGQQLYYRNQSGQMCQLNLVNGPSPSCMASPTEIIDLTSVQSIGQQLLLLGKNAVFLQRTSGVLQQLQPSVSSRSASFRPGIAVVPQGVVTINNWQLIDELQKVSTLVPQQGTATTCNTPTLNSSVSHHGDTHSVVAHHQNCTAIHQINSSDTSTDVILNTHSFNHPQMQLLAYNGNESMLIDAQSVVHVKRNDEATIKPLTTTAFKASAAQASATGWYFTNQATEGRTDLHYLAVGQVNQEPLKIAQQATPHFAASDSHLYWLDSNANSQMQIASWRNNSGNFQHQADVVLPEQYQPKTDSPVQMEVRNGFLLLWLDTNTNPDHRSLLLFDVKSPDQPVFIGAWTNPLDNKENNTQSSRISVDVQGQNIILQPFATAEVLQIGIPAQVDLTPRIIEQLFVVKEDSHETLTLTLQNADEMQLSILTPPTKGSASLTGNHLKYQPEANFHGSDSLVLMLSQGDASYEFPIKLDVTEVNDKPVIAPITELTVENGKTISGKAVATDIDSDKLVYRISETGSGVVSIAEDGQFTYQAKVPGADTFVIEVQDNQGAKASVRVSVTVAPITPDTPSTPSTSSTVKNSKKSGGSLAWGFSALVLVWRLRKKTR